MARRASERADGRVVPVPGPGKRRAGSSLARANAGPGRPWPGHTPRKGAGSKAVIPGGGGGGARAVVRERNDCGRAPLRAMAHSLFRHTAESATRQGRRTSLGIHGPDRTAGLIHYAIDESSLTLRVGPWRPDISERTCADESWSRVGVRFCAQVTAQRLVVIDPLLVNYHSITLVPLTRQKRLKRANGEIPLPNSNPIQTQIVCEASVSVR